MNTDDEINHLCFTTFNHLFAVATFDRHSGLFLWDLANGKLLRKFPAVKLDGQSALMALSDDGRYFVWRVKLELILFDMVEGKVVAKMASPPSIPGCSA